LTKNWEQNFLGGGKSASFLFEQSFRHSNRNSKGSGKNSRGEEGLMILESRGHGGRAFLKAGGGEVKMFMLPVI